MINFKDVILDELIIINPNDLAKVKISLNSPNSEKKNQTQLNSYAAIFNIEPFGKEYEDAMHLLDRILLSTRIDLEKWDKLNLLNNNQNLAEILEINDYINVLIFGIDIQFSNLKVVPTMLKIIEFNKTKILVVPDFQDFTKSVKENVWIQIQLLFNLK